MNRKKNTIKNNLQVTPEAEQTMRVLANLIIDRIFEDKMKGKLKFRKTINSGRNKAKNSIK